jgi:hypothetical protein
MKNILIACISILVLSASFFAQNETKPCPAIQVTAPNSKINPGDTMIFSVKVENELENPNLKYDWIVSAGTIINGQETSAIEVVTTPEMNGESVTAKVTIRNLPTNCINEKSETKQIEKIYMGCGLLDDYRKISTAMEKSMIDSVFMRFLDNPEYATIFFRLTSEKGETIKQTKSRIRRIVKLANFRQFDKRRLIFAIDKSKTNYYLTTASFVPKGNEFPECENCEIVKGEDVK